MQPRRRRRFLAGMFLGTCVGAVFPAALGMEESANWAARGEESVTVMDSIRYIVGQESATEQIGKATTCEQAEVRRLAERATDGDIEAFGELYNIHLDRIYRYVFHQVNNRAVAEDLTEEVFVKAWAGIGKYRWRGHPFSSWLYRIAHNHVVDYFRSSQQHQPLAEESLAGFDGPERELEGKRIHQLLFEAMSRLPQQQKQLIILKFIEGLDNREIEQVMHKGQGAIRVMQMRALATLRQKLAGEVDDAG